jgi:hypothetical protein
MTTPFLRPALALALALSLAACGGKATFPITGTVSGLIYDGLVLTTNGVDLPVKAGATTFSFPDAVSYGEVYNVVQKTAPAHQDCATVVRGTDTAGRLAAINVEVYCTVNSYFVGGTITGLTSAGLKLANGSDAGIVEPAAAATTFAFPNRVAFGRTYGITVLAQPATENCSVSPNGTAVMGDAAVNNIVITCVPK